MPPLYAWYSVELGRRKLLPLSFDPVLVTEFDRKARTALRNLDGHLSGHPALRHCPGSPSRSTFCQCKTPRSLASGSTLTFHAPARRIAAVFGHTGVRLRPSCRTVRAM